MNERYEGDWLIIELVPGLIEAASNRQFGRPVIAGTRIPTDAGIGMLTDDGRAGWPELTEEQRIAADAFRAGVEWQRNRKLRNLVSDAVAEGWRLHNEREQVGTGGYPRDMEPVEAP